MRKYTLQQLQVLSAGLLCLKAYAKWEKLGQTIDDRMKKDNKQIHWLAFVVSCNEFEMHIKDAASTRQKIPATLDMDSWDMEFASKIKSELPEDRKRAAEAWANMQAIKVDEVCRSFGQKCQNMHKPGADNWKEKIPDPKVFKSVLTTANKYLDSLNGDAIDDAIGEMENVSWRENVCYVQQYTAKPPPPSPQPPPPKATSTTTTIITTTTAKRTKRLIRSKSCHSCHSCSKREPATAASTTTTTTSTTAKTTKVAK